MFKKGVIFIDTYQGIVVHLQCIGKGLYMYEGWIHVITIVTATLFMGVVGL